ncbi:MAG TPA: choice-of-anchor Q domain-containing protein [Candidatus Saccharimonadia bacterium]|nr:choice-of-anchor Q domain-containing protein [Candidatus Saccharimonadia bacterium]
MRITDDGTPGHGYFPLLPGSPAIDAGNDAACPSTDQLGQRRVGPCDIGAIRFLDTDDRQHDEDDDQHDEGRREGPE